VEDEWLSTPEMLLVASYLVGVAAVAYLGWQAVLGRYPWRTAFLAWFAVVVPFVGAAWACYLALTHLRRNRSG
jgi:uncharacterized membrane protein YfbV (UPF0208 family)